ncbi:hypothetical protein Tco_1095557, partial [Tanacetum coccineum]
FKGIAKVALTHVKWGLVERVIVLFGVAGVKGEGLKKWQAWPLILHCSISSVVLVV